MLQSQPAMRTARILHSLNYVRGIAKSRGMNVAIAYTHSNGKLAMLWRDSDACLGALRLAEAASFSAVARASTEHDLREQLSTRARSLNQCMLSESDGYIEEPVEGGLPVMVDGKCVGGVAIVGDDGANLAEVAVLAYTAPVDGADEYATSLSKSGFSDTQIDHYAITLLDRVP